MTPAMTPISMTALLELIVVLCLVFAFVLFLCGRDDGAGAMLIIGIVVFLILWLA